MTVGIYQSNFRKTANTSSIIRTLLSFSPKTRNNWIKFSKSKRTSPISGKSFSLNGPTQDDWIISYDDFSRPGQKSNGKTLPATGQGRYAQDVATIVYTSGTPRSKGAVITQDNIIFTASPWKGVPISTTETKGFSFFPWPISSPAPWSMLPRCSAPPSTSPGAWTLLWMT